MVLLVQIKLAICIVFKMTTPCVCQPAGKVMCLEYNMLLHSCFYTALLLLHCPLCVQLTSIITPAYSRQQGRMHTSFLSQNSLYTIVM